MGALAVVLCANLAKQASLVEPADYVVRLRESLEEAPATEFVGLIEAAVASVRRGEPTAEFAIAAGMGRVISGYVYQTVPVCIHAWLSNENDFREAVRSVVRCGGDTDTTAAIVGGIVGSHVGKAGIPEEWLHNLGGMAANGRLDGTIGLPTGPCAVDRHAGAPLRLSGPVVFGRNLVFLTIVLTRI